MELVRLVDLAELVARLARRGRVVAICAVVSEADGKLLELAAGQASEPAPEAAARLADGAV